MKRARIVLYGHFGSGNIGNDSSLEAALSNVRQRLPDAEIVCVCNGPDVVAERFGIATVPIDTTRQRQIRPQSDWFGTRIARRVQRISIEAGFFMWARRWFRDVDMFIVVGTGAVDDMAVQRPWHAPFDLYKWCKGAKLGGAKVVFLSVGVGPIVNPTSRRLMFSALRMADRRSYRETAALEYLRKFGFDATGDRLFPDLVFSLEVERWNRPAAASGAVRCVGLGLINYRGWSHDPIAGEPVFRAYIEKMKGFLRWLLEQGYDVRLIVGDLTDEPCVTEMHAFLETEPMRKYRDRVVAEPIADLDALFEQISRTDLVVASRFHNLLCSLMLRRPVVSVGYHEKNDLLLGGFGLADYCQHIETFTLDRLIDHFRRSVAQHAQITAHLGERLSEYRHALDQQYDELLAGRRAA